MQLAFYRHTPHIIALLWWTLGSFSLGGIVSFLEANEGPLPLPWPEAQLLVWCSLLGLVIAVAICLNDRAMTRRSGLKAFQVGDTDIVAAYTPREAIAVLCEQIGYSPYEFTFEDVTRVSDKTLDALEVFNQDEGRVEMLDLTLREELLALSAPAYLYGWE